jgi:hypothetical protein
LKAKIQGKKGGFYFYCHENSFMIFSRDAKNNQVGVPILLGRGDGSNVWSEEPKEWKGKTDRKKSIEASPLFPDPFCRDSWQWA